MQTIPEYRRPSRFLPCVVTALVATAIAWGVILGLSAMGCDPIDQPIDSRPTITGAQAGVRDVSADNKARASRIVKHADQAFAASPAVKPHTDAIKTEAAGVVANSGRLDQVVAELDKAKNETAEMATQRDQWKARAEKLEKSRNSWLTRFCHLVYFVGGLGLAVAGYFAYAGDIKHAGVIAVLSAGAITAAWLLLNAMLWIIVGCLAVAAIAIVHLVATKTNALDEVDDQLHRVGKGALTKTEEIWRDAVDTGERLWSNATTAIMSKLRKTKDIAAVKSGQAVVVTAAPLSPIAAAA